MNYNFKSSYKDKVPYCKWYQTNLAEASLHTDDVSNVSKRLES